MTRTNAKIKMAMASKVKSILTVTDAVAVAALPGKTISYVSAL